MDRPDVRRLRADAAVLVLLSTLDGAEETLRRAAGLLLSLSKGHEAPLRWDCEDVARECRTLADTLEEAQSDGWPR